MTVAPTTPASTVDAVIGQLVTELGGSLGVLLIALGNRCGLWTAMAGAGPLTPAELARAHRRGRTARRGSGAARRPRADI